jgi:hypothetical protein
MSFNRRAYTSLKQTLLSGGTIFRCSAFVGAAAGMCIALAPDAKAFVAYSGNLGGQNLEVNLDTTVEYSNIFRVNSPSKVLTSDINANDGDLDFQHGLVDNTFDALPVLDLKYGDFGAHFSGEFYLDTPYLGETQNNSPSTYNPYSVAKPNDFTSATRNVNGENAVLLDAFVYGTKYFDDGQQTATLKVGRQTLLWGQSLFFPSNGIAAGQAPFDVIKAQSLPNAQVQQIDLPVGQVVVTYAPSTALSFQAYYQFEWKPDTLQGVGAYFSTSDILDKGGQRIIVAPGAAYLYRLKDLRPPIDNGQFGGSVQGTIGAYDLGVYALRYDSKAPEGIYTGAAAPGGGPGNVASYWLVYPRDIQLYGASISTVTNWGAQIGAEVSGRRNMPLVSVAAPGTAYPGSANAGALYPVGSTVAAQISSIYVSPGIPLDPGGVTVDGEFAMNHVVSVAMNQALLEPNRNESAGAFQFTISPTYDNLIPSLDLSFPVGLHYGLFGRSQVDSTMNHGTGFVNVGVNGNYRTVWTGSLTYQDYFGAPDPVLNPLADRGFVEFSIQRTF